MFAYVKNIERDLGFMPSEEVMFNVGLEAYLLAYESKQVRGAFNIVGPDLRVLISVSNPAGAVCFRSKRIHNSDVSDSIVAAIGSTAAEGLLKRTVALEEWHKNQTRNAYFKIPEDLLQIDWTPDLWEKIYPNQPYSGESKATIYWRIFSATARSSQDS